MRIVSRGELKSADLIVDAVYQGDRRGGYGDDPLPDLTGVSVGGGFRYLGKLGALDLLVLTSNKRDPDWPDEIDRETGIYTYYGDNKEPGRELHGTKRFGNLILQQLFEDASRGRSGREQVPPILIFTAAGHRRDVMFLGLAVPGTGGQRYSEDLVAIWHTRDSLRFQNYRARFTVLRTESISRAWINSIQSRCPDPALAPPEWNTWVETGRITPLLAPRTIQHRTRLEQLPGDPAEQEMLQAIHGYFATDPYAFETCAAELARMMLPDIAAVDLTRRVVDGGRDAVGQFRIGAGPSAILVDFAIEAKCYASTHSVGVSDMSRLISRLRHRQFGVLVTTSYVHHQAYKEIKEDQHPILVLAGADIVNLLKRNGYGTPFLVRSWLEQGFPPTI
jgi:hypothetical protein